MFIYVIYLGHKVQQIQPSYTNWAPWISPTSCNGQVLNSEFRKLPEFKTRTSTSSQSQNTSSQSQQPGQAMEEDDITLTAACVTDLIGESSVCTCSRNLSILLNKFCIITPLKWGYKIDKYPVSFCPSLRPSITG